MRRFKIKEVPLMQKKEFVFFGYHNLIIQIGDNYSAIPYFGKSSYGVCGKELRLVFINEFTGEVHGLAFKGGYIDRIFIEGDEKFRLHVKVDYFNPPHPACKSEESLTYEVRQLL